MTTYTMTGPDGKDYSIDGPAGALQADVAAQMAAAHSNLTAAPGTPAAPVQQTGAQPSMMQTIAASPIGRAAQNVVIRPIEGLASMLAKIDPTGGAVAPAVAQGEKSYNDAIQAQQNRPGYAAARSQANTVIGQQGHGLTDQFTAPFNPAIAGVAGLLTGGLNGMNATADAQTAAQQGYQQQNPNASTAAQITGGLMVLPEGMTSGLLAASKVPQQTIAKPFIPSIDDLKSAAKDAYQTVDNSGVQVSSDAMNNMADRLQDNLGPRLDPTLHPDATAAFNRVMQYATDGAKGASSASFTDLDNLRRVVADAAKSPKPSDAAMAGFIKDHVDNFVDGLTPASLDTSLQDQMRSDLVSATAQKGQIAKQIKAIEQNSPGALISKGAAGAGTRDTYMTLHQQLQDAEQARQTAMGAFKNESDLLSAGPQQTIDALNNARGYWSRAKQSELIQGVMDDAELRAGGYTQSGYENAVRSGFRNLALNKKKMALLGPDLQDAVKSVAMGSPLSNTLRNIGRFAPHGPVAAAAGAGLGSGIGAMAGGLAGAAGGSGIGAALLPLVGESARSAATRMTTAAAQRALETAALGQSVPVISGAAALARPAIPAASQLPYGLIGSGAFQFQPRTQ